MINNAMAPSLRVCVCVYGKSWLVGPDNEGSYEDHNDDELKMVGWGGGVYRQR